MNADQFLIYSINGDENDNDDKVNNEKYNNDNCDNGDNDGAPYNGNSELIIVGNAAMGSELYTLIIITAIMMMMITKMIKMKIIMTFFYNEDNSNAVNKKNNNEGRDDWQRCSGRRVAPCLLVAGPLKDTIFSSFSPVIHDLRGCRGTTGRSIDGKTLE